MHHRGTVTTPDGEIVRASVWIEQEIAIAAFIQQMLGRKIEVQLYIQEGIAREGMRDKLLLNAYTFKQNQEVLDHLKQRIAKWVLVGDAARPDRAFEENFQQKLNSAKSNFWLRTSRRGGVEGQMRSDTRFWIYLFPVKPTPVAVDLNVSQEFISWIYKNFPTDHYLAGVQGTQIQPEVTFDKAREFVLPVVALKEERRWRLTSTGEIGFVAQSVWPLDSGPTALWSAYDVALDTLSLLRLASCFWDKYAYWGPVRLVAELYIGQAKLAVDHSAFPALFHQQAGSPPDHVALDPGVFIGKGANWGSASAQVDPTLGSLGNLQHNIAAEVLYHLACGLGYEVDLPRLQTSLRTIFS